MRQERSPSLIPRLLAALVAVAVAVAAVWLVTAERRAKSPSETTAPDAERPLAEVPPVVPEEWKGRHGRWHIGDWRDVPFEEQRSLTPEQEQEIERLRSIGYLSGKHPAPLQSGVTVYDRDRTVAGLNFYTTGDVPGAVLMDMQGRVLHKWAYGYIDAWVESPDRPELRTSAKGSGFWRRAYVFGNGDVLAVFDGLAILKVNSRSELQWVNFGGFHHDLEVMPDGRIFVLTREAHIVPWYNADEPVLEDYVAVLDADGRELERVSVLEAIAGSEFASALDVAEPSGDILHSNTVEVLDGRLEGRIPAFRKGNVLVTVREIDLVVVIDMESGLVVWAEQGHWRAPHQATVLANGNLMIFDNRGNEGSSRVVEFDPVTLDTVWEFKGEMPEDFRSLECGSNHRLPNGNTLIVETDRGAAFEVTPDGETVWKYINPAQAGPELEYIASLFDVHRLPPDFGAEWVMWKRQEDR
jgi:hypothetical protein